jgi:hypothetical protein
MKLPSSKPLFYSIFSTLVICLLYAAPVDAQESEMETEENTSTIDDLERLHEPNYLLVSTALTEAWAD